MILCRTSARQALLWRSPFANLAVSLDLAGMPLAAAHALRLAGRMATN